MMEESGSGNFGASTQLLSLDFYLYSHSSMSSQQSDNKSEQFNLVI